MSLRRCDISQNLKSINEKIEAAFARRMDVTQKKPLLVAVSKTKPDNLIVEAYKHGHRHFGENYVQELATKANSSTILENCPEIKWHFIGHLQSNKIKKVLSAPNLYMVETVDSEKLASQMNNVAETVATLVLPLKVLVQINTSGEKEKSGVTPDKAVELFKFIKENCPSLDVRGVMTIGAYGFDTSQGLNPDFVKLVECCATIYSSLKLDFSEAEISMGMSTDYEQAVELGSTIVRVGSSIFGERNTA